uniref:OmpA family protein n=2 Tax=Gelidibacter sp. TaxID=2018083 RepID=UPI00404A934B
MTKYYFYIFILLSNWMLSQNLVLNPSFEEFKDCPWQIGRFNKNVTDWSTPNLSSTDFFNNCSKSVGFVNYNGNQEPKTGNSYAGFYLFSPDNYREYVQGELSQTLSVGKQYKITFYISLAENSTYSLNNINLLFTQERLGFKPVSDNKSVLTQSNYNYNPFKHIDENYIKPSEYTKLPFEMIHFKNELFYNHPEKWTEITIIYTASGYENFFSIGNFDSNSKTEKQQRFGKQKHEFAYYYIDDVSIQSLEKSSSETIVDELPEVQITLENHKIYTFKNVLFDFDKADLLPISLDELQKLYSHLETNQQITIEIYGHTDAVGTQSRNEQLSQERANAVANYLMSLGLDSERIKWFGYGSSKPVATNSTDEGRAQNRRVEFQLFEY